MMFSLQYLNNYQIEILNILIFGPIYNLYLLFVFKNIDETSHASPKSMAYWFHWTFEIFAQQPNISTVEQIFQVRLDIAIQICFWFTID